MKYGFNLFALILTFFISSSSFAQNPTPIGASKPANGSESERQKQDPTTNNNNGSNTHSSKETSGVVITLQMPQGGGKNGAGVAYDPVRKLYYAVMAGNVAFPMAVFNIKGEVVNDDLTAKFDTRGIWYNPKTKSIEANGYDDFGVVSWNVNSSGIPTGTTTIFDYPCQPHANAVGAFDPVNNEIIYFDEENSEIVRYSRATGKRVGSIYVEDGSLGVFNSTSVVYTGIAHQEIGLLDYDMATVYMFDIKTGDLTNTIDLPTDAVTYSWMNFSFCNGMFWLFNTDTRVWSGYKI